MTQATEHSMTDAMRAPSRTLAHACALVLTVVFLVLPSVLPARAAVEIQEVRSPGGITAWLVEDYTVPLIAVRFAFDGGSTQDPAGKEGLANLMTGLFDEGAGEMDSDAFQERLDEVGAEMSFSAARDGIYGQMRMLAEEREGALDLLRLALTDPRFDQEPIDRIRSQIVTGIRAKERDPERIGYDEFAKAFYGDHPYARSSEGTVETLNAITAQDLVAFHEAQFARSNVSIAVVGAIDAETLGAELDRVFGALPAQDERTEVARAEPDFELEFAYDYPLPQATLQLVYPGVERQDPEFFAAYLMNHILGGGTFSSRLFNEVREKRGLAYGVGSYLSNSDYVSTLVIGTSTRADRADETLEIVREEVRRMAEDGPTEKELADAKTYVVGAYAINNLDSSAAVARTLVELQKDDLGIDYIDRRAELIEAVTLDEVRAAARRVLTQEPARMVIGPGDEAQDDAVEEGG